MAPFISFEGIDGSGKTTQIKLLEKYLKSRDVPVVVAREPGGTEVGESIRQVLLKSGNTALRPLSELLLYNASRHQNLYQRVLPALEAGYWVLSDRYVDASMAYQGYGRGVDVSLIDQLNNMVINQHMPNLTVLIDMDPALAVSRAQERNRHDSTDEGRFERESLEFYQRVRQGYLEIAANDPLRVRVVNGDKPIETLHREIVSLLKTSKIESGCI